MELNLKVLGSQQLLRVVLFTAQNVKQDVENKHVLGQSQRQ